MANAVLKVPRPRGIDYPSPSPTTSRAATRASPRPTSGALRAAGDAPFLSVEQGVERYLQWWPSAPDREVKADPRRILVVGLSWVGDMVMAQSLFMTLKAADPAVEIDARARLVAAHHGAHA